MKRLLALGLCMALLCPAAAAARSDLSGQGYWTRVEGEGDYVTLRVPAPEGEEMNWAEQNLLCVRYADTGEPVALTSSYQAGYLFATVPAAQSQRPLESFTGEEFRFLDCISVWEGTEYYTDAWGAGDLYLRGILHGDEHGYLNPDGQLSRAEAFTLIVRLLSLAPSEDPGYADVSSGAWYYDTVSAARAAGIAAADTCFHPERPVTRGEFTVMMARAMERVGWLDVPEEGTADQLTGVADAAQIPEWALASYLAFGEKLGIFTQQVTGERDPYDGAPECQNLAEWEKTATRGEVIAFINHTRRMLPWYPTPLAVDWGFDEGMPVIDGSTSTYPYTVAVYGALFGYGEDHPQFPASHSKSHESYERLINGEVDMLFAATLPSEDLKAQAAAAGVELECIPIAYDAMVFFTNAENTITGLTMEQIQDIYVYGKYDNWSQVGGPDAGLLPYRRNTDSGSHALMEYYFLEGGKLSLSPDVHNVLTSYAMSSALTDVADAMTEDPLAYAMGYSVYYYYQNSYWLLGDSQNGGDLKLLAVDGVVPNDQTIADGSYPLAGYNYVVMRADEPEDSLARRMAAFMLSEEGQNCVASAGFGPLSNDPKADLQAQMPGWTVLEVIPAGEIGYMSLSQNNTGGTLRGGFLKRGTETSWGMVTQADCPAPGQTGMTAALVGGEQGCSMVFGQVAEHQYAPDGTVFLVDGNKPMTLRLTLSDGSVRTQTVYGVSPFHFLLEQGETPVKLELTQRGETIACVTDFLV